MEHTLIVTAAELENYADTRDSECVVPELVYMLINACPGSTRAAFLTVTKLTNRAWTAE